MIHQAEQSRRSRRFSKTAAEFLVVTALLGAATPAEAAPTGESTGVKIARIEQNSDKRIAAGVANKLVKFAVGVLAYTKRGVDPYTGMLLEPHKVTVGNPLVAPLDGKALKPDHNNLTSGKVVFGFIEVFPQAAATTEFLPYSDSVEDDGGKITNVHFKPAKGRDGQVKEAYFPIDRSDGQSAINRPFGIKGPLTAYVGWANIDGNQVPPVPPHS